MLGNIVPLNLMHLVINNFLEKGWEGIMKIVVAMLLYLRLEILAMDDETILMESLSVQILQNKKMHW